MYKNGGKIQMKDKECAGGNHFEKNVCLFLYLSEYKPMVLKNNGMFIKKKIYIGIKVDYN